MKSRRIGEETMKNRLRRQKKRHRSRERYPLPRRQHGLAVAAAPRRRQTPTSSSTTSPQTTATSSSLPPSKLKPSSRADAAKGVTAVSSPAIDTATPAKRLRERVQRFARGVHRFCDVRHALDAF